MSSKTRDLYIPKEQWTIMVDLVAPEARGTDPAFIRAMDMFSRYSATIKGDIGDIITRCQKHLTRFLDSAQKIIDDESGELPERLGRLREFPYGKHKLQFQVFSYKGAESISIRSDRMATLLSDYQLFHGTLTFLKKQVDEGNLGVFKNSILFIYKPLSQAAELYDAALHKLPIDHTTEVGIKADPHYVHIVGKEPSDDIEDGFICRVIKEGYAWEGTEIQEGVVVVAGTE